MFSHLSPAHKGELYIYAQSFLWSLFPVITILTFSGVTPIYSAAIGSFLSSVFFAIVVTVKKGWNQCNSQAPWKDIFIASFFIGFVFYTLYFTGLKYTTAGNASIVALFEVFFSFLILTVLVKHERLFLSHVLGAIFMLFGAAIILIPKANGWNVGDILIIIGTMVAPLANTYMQRARKKVSSEFILFVRGFIAGFFLLMLAYVSEPLPTIQTLRGSLAFLCVNGFLLLGFSKFLWLESIHLIPITKAVSLASITPVFTLIFAYTILHERVNAFQIIALLPITFGVFLLTRKKLEIDTIE
jgi:drug/metabolite transporter (DMT)-like permease